MAFVCRDCSDRNQDADQQTGKKNTNGIFTRIHFASSCKWNRGF